MSFITWEKARLLKLKGKPVRLQIGVVGGVTYTIESEVYKVTLFGKNGAKVVIEVPGMEKISIPMNAEKFEHSEKKFPCHICNYSRPAGRERLTNRDAICRISSSERGISWPFIAVEESIWLYNSRSPSTG